MPETAYYDPVHFQEMLPRRHTDMVQREPRQPRVLHNKPDNAANRIPPKRGFKAPQMAYKNSSDDSGSSEEGNEIYESLEQLNVRKSREDAHRRAKIARVVRTGHPLFDSLREERALKENVSAAKPKKSVGKLSPKNISSKQQDFEEEKKYIRASQSLSNMKNYGKYSSNPKIVVHESQPQEPSRKHSAQFSSLQKLNPDKHNRNHRKVSEGYQSRTLPSALALTKKNLAKSEQNLSYLHQLNHPVNLGGRTHFNQWMMMNHAPHPAMAPYSHHGHRLPARVPRKAPVESSDSDSDWIIPRPKFATQKSRNRSSDDSDYSGPLWR